MFLSPLWFCSEVNYTIKLINLLDYHWWMVRRRRGLNAEWCHRTTEITTVIPTPSPPPPHTHTETHRGNSQRLPSGLYVDIKKHREKPKKEPLCSRLCTQEDSSGLRSVFAREAREKRKGDNGALLAAACLQHTGWSSKWKQSPNKTAKFRWNRQNHMELKKFSLVTQWPPQNIQNTPKSTNIRALNLALKIYLCVFGWVPLHRLQESKCNEFMVIFPQNTLLCLCSAL